MAAVIYGSLSVSEWVGNQALIKALLQAGAIIAKFAKHLKTDAKYSAVAQKRMTLSTL